MSNKKDRLSAINKDPISIINENYNEASSAVKVLIIEPVVKQAVIATDIVGFGRMVKVTGTSYTLDLLNAAYNSSSVYMKGNIVSNGGFVYIATDDNVTGVFDSEKWQKVSTKQIGPIDIGAGSVVCTGKWHNNVSAAGFLIEDDSFFHITRY